MVIKKTNKQMMILSFMGIVFVVDNHCGQPLSFLTSIFPYNSFFMPMFVFISGYFFNPELLLNLKNFILHKIKNLIKPFLIYNLILGGGGTLVFELFDVYWMGAYSIDDFIYLSLTYGTPFDITSASWFIVMLFFVIVSYSITRAIFEAFWNDLFFLFIFILIGCCSIYLTHTNIVNIQYMILPLKIMFFLQFYQLGYCYYKYNNAFNILNKYKLFFALSFLLSIFIHFFYSNSDITYNSLAFMQSFKTNNFILPFITATIGILFYLCLSECLIAILGNNYIVNLISNNTLIILISHLFCFNIINLGVLYGNVFNDFNKSVFYSSSWYVYGNNNGILWLYLLFGLFGPIVFSYSLSKFYKYIVSRIIKVYSSVKNL